MGGKAESIAPGDSREQSSEAQGGGSVTGVESEERDVESRGKSEGCAARARGQGKGVAHEHRGSPGRSLSQTRTSDVVVIRTRAFWKPASGFYY